MSIQTDKAVCRIVRLAFIAIAFSTLSSCIGYLFPDSDGFPRNVFLSADGGTQVFYGSGLYGISMYDHSRTEGICERDTLENKIEIVRRGWLTLIYDRRTGEMTFKAEPNDTRLKRHMTISGMVLDEGVCIEVYQGRK